MKFSSGFALHERKRASEDLNLPTASIFTIRALHLSEVVAGTSTLDLPATLAVGISFCREWLGSSSLIRDILDSLIVKSAAFRLAPKCVGAYPPLTRRQRQPSSCPAAWSPFHHLLRYDGPPTCCQQLPTDRFWYSRYKFAALLASRTLVVTGVIQGRKPFVHYKPSFI